MQIALQLTWINKNSFTIVLCLTLRETHAMVGALILKNTYRGDFCASYDYQEELVPRLH